MFYIIYKTTNQINGKFYIGKHQTNDLNDGYLGSGTLLKRAIQKHGRQNFKKEILHVFDNEEEIRKVKKYAPHAGMVLRIKVPRLVVSPTPLA